ncbi:ABC transporter ATP-binding protein [Phototrophicus methaneseepsis]|uniref:ABC transporter ATP-binding protein n=1 Tax=Phototrophicus methaneseepsis TaxID=2710758 RepID=A0A7S8EAI7_9CHLR|nr:ABC transporter ATP-binding protein [Phototrophicus methaneseepsis]QPC83364.1 ABC transporter ATP-binding protein [Phototrophicus methaneseepsis]
MTTNNVLLQVKDLRTHFFTEGGVVRAVDGVSFDIQPGKTLGVLGESGCGKSVTGFSILQLINPPGRVIDGEILYHREKNGREEIVDLAKLNPRGEEIRRIRGNEIAMIFQEPMTSLDPLFTIGDQLAEAVLVHQKVSKRAALDRATELLDKVRLPQARSLLKQYPHQLSGGMRQRVMIAMALTGQPKLLIADEPTTALDVTTEAQILELMQNLQDEFGMAMMFVTHDLGVIAEMATDVVVMYLGRVVEKTDIQSLFKEPKHPYTRALLESIPKVGHKVGGHLQTIEGMVPSPFNIPPGCPFHPRCASFMPGVCDAALPADVPLDDEHSVRCFLYSEKTEGDQYGSPA